ncbi:glycosyltransferase [Zhongshania borealis]|uniref:Glycosyltransferase n=1 Tax=Zhongshania borealis TaxID=889488 RepID=A0ABP7W958_9GAMM
MRIYVPVAYKLLFAMALAFGWLGFSVWLAWPWIQDLSRVFTPFGAWFMILGVALLPGMASAFVVVSLILDRRPIYKPHHVLPGVSILIAAYNEALDIEKTIESILVQVYPGEVEVLVIDDASTDNTAALVDHLAASGNYSGNFKIKLISASNNGGKSAALNLGLAQASHDYIITVDGDTYLFKDALANLVINLVDGPPKTGAVAGTVLVRNSRKSLITRLQEWDYFLGIAVVKRTQSLYQGTLVAQGAFSIYRREVLEELGGWPNTMGEDIVLTWGIARNGWRVSYAENAFVFTNVPENYSAYFRQRRRWARGLIEAFKMYPDAIYVPRLNTPFVYFNLMFPYIDFSYLFIFFPGIICALFFQWYALVGVMTLLLLPLATLCNALMYYHQRSIFKLYGLKIRKNILGMLIYSLFYQLYLTPASLAGYLSELLRQKRSW